MPFGTEPGARQAPTLVHLSNGRHLVKVLAEAPYQKNNEAVKTEIIKVLGNDSFQVVFGNKDGAIDWSLPVSPPPGTGWTPESITGNINTLAEYSGVVPNATKTGIPSAKYRSGGGFLQDLVNRGGWMWIVVAQDPRNVKYSRFSYIEGPAAEGEVGEEVGEDEPF